MKRVEKNEKIVIDIAKDEKKEHTKKIIKTITIIMVLLMSLLYYMRFIEPSELFIKEVKISDKQIPESLNGLKIVHFSDLHYKMTTNEKELKHLVKKINELKPDILVFTGDLLDSIVTYEDNDYKVLAHYLDEIRVTNSKYYVKGNHDYFTEQVDSILQNANFISLNNKSDVIYGENQEHIQLVGLGSFIQNDFKMTEAFQNVNSDGSYTIALFHEPDNIMELNGKNVQLALAGHSHNTQINIPLLSSLYTPEGAKTYYHNDYEVGNTKLYVNAGIGTSIYKLRLFAPPTVNLYRLVHKK